MSGCLDNFPNELEPTLPCLSDSLSAGPASGLLILVIGIPLIGVVKAYLRKLLDNVDFDEGLENFLYRISGVALWAIVILTAADEFGINVTGLVVGLGFIGLAVAFAAQDTVENVIAGVFIIIDRPFREGERILLPKSLGGTYSKWGDVTYIGLRTTRVRSTDGVLLTIPNKLLTKDAVANFSHSSDRLLHEPCGITPTIFCSFSFVLFVLMCSLFRVCTNVGGVLRIAFVLSYMLLHIY